MSELIVVGFKKDMYRASEALNQVKDLNKSWDLDLSDAVAVYRDYDGKLRVDQSYQMTTGQGAAWGGLFGGLIGALLAAPFTAGASVAGAAAAVIGAGSLGGVALGASLGAIRRPRGRRPAMRRRRRPGRSRDSSRDRGSLTGRWQSSSRTSAIVAGSATAPAQKSASRIPSPALRTTATIRFRPRIPNDQGAHRLTPPFRELAEFRPGSRLRRGVSKLTICRASPRRRSHKPNTANYLGVALRLPF